MTQHHSFRRILIGVSAVVVALGAATAEAGNYQDHVVADTTRHTIGHSEAIRPQASKAADDVAENRQQAGSYQSHVLPHTTRRDVRVQSHAVPDSDNVAVNHTKRWLR